MTKNIVNLTCKQGTKTLSLKPEAKSCDIKMDEVKFLTPSLTLHTFKDKIADSDIFFQVLKMSDSFYIWLGKTEKFGELSVAMSTLQKTTSSANLIGKHDSHSSVLAQRLCKKTGKQVFVGGDMSSVDQLQLPLVEKRIIEEMKTHPEKF